VGHAELVKVQLELLGGAPHSWYYRRVCRIYCVDQDANVGQAVHGLLEQFEPLGSEFRYENGQSGHVPARLGEACHYT